jgi:hypothetical protein
MQRDYSIEKLTNSAAHIHLQDTIQNFLHRLEKLFEDRLLPLTASQSRRRLDEDSELDERQKTNWREYEELVNLRAELARREGSTLKPFAHIACANNT